MLSIHSMFLLEGELWQGVGAPICKALCTPAYCFLRIDFKAVDRIKTMKKSAKKILDD